MIWLSRAGLDHVSFLKHVSRVARRESEEGGVMSSTDLKDAEAFLRECLTPSEPMRPGELIERGSTEPFAIPAAAIRRAVWHLVSLGEVTFDD